MKTYGKNAAEFSIREIVFTGLMTALVFVATYVPHIPIPLGYAHLGDAVIFLLAVLAPRRSVLFAACLGSAMADIFGGFALWAGPTILISSSWRKLSAAWAAAMLSRQDADSARRHFFSQAFGWRQAIPSRERCSMTVWRRRSHRRPGFSPRALPIVYSRCSLCLPCGNMFRGGKRTEGRTIAVPMLL